MLNNPNSAHFTAGDTLRYTLTYLSYGNFTAKGVLVQFSQTDYFVPLGNSTMTVDPIAPGRRGAETHHDTAHTGTSRKETIKRFLQLLNATAPSGAVQCSALQRKRLFYDK